MQKVLRSLIHEKLPEELRFQLELLSRKRNLINDERVEKILQLFRDFNIDNVIPLGLGTNRYAVKVDGYVIKIATDNDGKIDNFKEFKMSKRLYPYVTKTYEVSENGTILVAEYVSPFTSFSEMMMHANEIREILSKLSSTYLIGDVGITAKNYANWGLRTGNSQPVCLDFAYVYEVSSELFVCRKCGSMLIPDNDFKRLHCSNNTCKSEDVEFESIRAKLGNDLHKHEIGDLREEGYYLTESNVTTELSEQRSNYLVNQKKKKESIKEEDTMSNNIENNMAIARSLNVRNQFDIPTFIGTSKVVIDDKKEEVIVLNGTTKAVESVNEKLDDEDINDVAFSCSMDDDIPATTGYASVVEEYSKEPDDHFIMNDEPIIVETKEIKNAPINVAAKKNKPKINDWFVNNMYKAFSKISNRVSNYMKSIDHYNNYNYLLKSKMEEYKYYKCIESAVFRSLTNFCNFTYIIAPRDNGEGDRKIFTPPTEINGTNYEPTLIFMSRVWCDRDVYTAGDNLVMSSYRSKYSDYQGFQVEWIDSFKKRITGKTNMPKKLIDIIADDIQKEWCVPYFESLDDDNEEDIEATIMFPTDVVDEDDDSEDVAFSGSTGVDIVQGYVNDEYDDEDEDNESDNISVCIYHHESMDVVRINSTSIFGNINIPLYCVLDDIDSTTIGESMIDDRNGIWDWLIHMTPDVVFTTNNPDRWIAINDSDDYVNIPRVAILDETDDVYTIGVYSIDGIFDIASEDDFTLVTDINMLKKINRLINNEIGYSCISHLKVSIGLEDLIMTEEEVMETLNMEFPDEDESEEVDESTNISSEEAPVEDDSTEEVIDSKTSAAEQAAIDAMMADESDESSYESASEEVADEDYFRQEDEEETEGSEEAEVRTETSEADAEGNRHVYEVTNNSSESLPDSEITIPATFKPIRRFNS